MLKRLIGIGVALAIAAGLWGFQMWKAKSDAPEVGDCVVAEGSGDSVDLKIKECGADDVLYKVTADDGNCDVNEANYTYEVRGADAVDVCLFPEVKVGECINIDPKQELETKVACTTKGENILKVTAVDYKSADTKCAEPTVPIDNKTRKSVICLAPNAA